MGRYETVDMTFSVTKSYLSTVAGLAVDRRLFLSSEKVADYVWDHTFDGEHNQQITWEDLKSISGLVGEFMGWPWLGRSTTQNRRLMTGNTEHYIPQEPTINTMTYGKCLGLFPASSVAKIAPASLKEKVMDPIGASSSWRWYGYENSGWM